MPDYFGKEVPKLGFGLMRLPILTGSECPVSMEKGTR